MKNMKKDKRILLSYPRWWWNKVDAGKREDAGLKQSKLESLQKFCIDI